MILEISTPYIIKDSQYVKTSDFRNFWVEITIKIEIKIFFDKSTIELIKKLYVFGNIRYVFTFLAYF